MLFEGSRQRDLIIDEVHTTAGLDAFLAFPRRIYADDPDWVPPLQLWLRRKLSASNPLFRTAEISLFVARRGDEVVGTISALRDRKHEEITGEKVAFFGFFECIDDPAVAAALIGRAEDRARTWGATTLRGPRNLSRSEEVGLTVEGFGTAPPFLASHTRDYYVPLIEDQGFTKHHDVLAYDHSYFDEDGNPTPIPADLLAKARAVDIPGLEVRPTRWHRITKDLTLAHRVFAEPSRAVPENTPMTRAQFLTIGRAVLAYSNANMLQLATVDGEPAGFALIFPEVNEAIARSRGKLFPLGWARLLTARRHIRTASFKLIGVLPEYRRSGLHALMIERAVEGGRAAGYRRLEASLVDARNTRMRRVIEGAGMSIYRRYRVYERGM